MAFNDKIQVWIVEPVIDFTSSTGDKFVWQVKHPMLIHMVEMVTTTARSGTISTEGVAKLRHTPSGSSVTDKAVFTTSSTKFTAVGDTISADSAYTPFVVDKNDKIHFNLATQMAGTTPATAGKFIIYYELIPDGTV